MGKISLRSASLLLLGLLMGSSGAWAGPFVVFPISTETAQEVRPRIDGNVVVWSQVSPANNDVYGFDLARGQRLIIADGPNREDSPVISGDVVLWGESVLYDHYDIYGVRLSDGGKFVVASGSNIKGSAALDGQQIVWEEYRNGRYVIMGKKLGDPVGSERNISEIVEGFEKHEPDISGKNVVWEAFNGASDIYWRSLSGGPQLNLTDTAGDQLSPRVAGDKVVWQDGREGPPHIYGINLSGGIATRISGGGTATQWTPAIDGDLVVWADYRSGRWDIWGRLLSGGTEFQITDTPGIDEMYPDVSGNIVVWEQHGSGTRGIYGAVVPEPEAMAMVGAISLLLCWGERRWVGLIRHVGR